MLCYIYILLHLTLKLKNLSKPAKTLPFGDLKLQNDNVNNDTIL